MRGYIAPISFGALLAILAIATIVGVGVSVLLHRTSLIPIVIGVVIAIGVVYILVTVSPDEAPSAVSAPPPAGSPASTGPVAPAGGSSGAPAPAISAPAAPVDPVDLEPDYDPVAEADQLDSKLPP